MKEIALRAGLQIKLKLVLFKKRRCNVPKMGGKYAHAHCQEIDTYYGQICINPKFLDITPEHGVDYLMAHEVAHFFHYKHGKAHTELTRTLLDA